MSRTPSALPQRLASFAAKRAYRIWVARYPSVNTTAIALTISPIAPQSWTVTGNLSGSGWPAFYIHGVIGHPGVSTCRASLCLYAPHSPPNKALQLPSASNRFEAPPHRLASLASGSCRLAAECRGVPSRSARSQLSADPLGGADVT